MKGSLVRSLLFACCLLGGVLSAVSLHSHYSTSATEYCDLNTTFNCDLVNRSTYSEFLGVPVALIGMLGYILLFALSARRGKWVAVMRLVAALIGLGFALYLAYVEAHILAVWCLLCLGSLAAIAAITMLSAVSLRQGWTADSDSSQARASSAVLLKALTYNIFEPVKTKEKQS